LSLNVAFEHCITTIPLSIAVSETKLYQSDKSGLRKIIIDECHARTNNAPIRARWIIDCMAIIRASKPEKTF